MNKNINIQSQKIFNQFKDKLNFKLSYQNYQKILLLMKKEDLSNINNYIKKKYNNYYMLYVQMILSYYSDIYLKTNIQNYNFCLELIKKNGLTLQYVLNNIKDKYYQINLEAVKQNGLALEYVSNQYKDDYQINLEAVKEKGYILEYISNKFKNDKQILKLKTHI